MKTIDKNELIRLYQSGLNCEQVGKHFDASGAFVLAKLTAYGIPRRPPGRIPDTETVFLVAKLRASGWTLQRIGDKLGVTRQRIHQISKQ